MDSSFDLLGIDNSCADLVFSVPALPSSDQSVRMDDYSLQGGGKVATALVATARTGVTCGIIGNVGSDRYGDFLREDFEMNNVATDFLFQQKGDTAFSIVLVEQEQIGKRVIVWNPGNLPPLKEGELPEEMLKKCRCLHLCRTSPAELRAAEIVKKAGGQVTFDGDFVEPDIDTMIPLIDHFIASRDFAEEYLPADYDDDSSRKYFLKKIIDKGAGRVVLTLGSRGSVGMAADEKMIRCESFDVKAVDTTGAGDVFHGGYIAGLLNGLSFPKTLEWASATAALKTLSPGGRSGIPDRKMIEEFLDTGREPDTGCEERIEYYRKSFYRLDKGTSEE